MESLKLKDLSLATKFPDSVTDVTHTTVTQGRMYTQVTDEKGAYLLEAGLRMNRAVGVVEDCFVASSNHRGDCVTAGPTLTKFRSCAFSCLMEHEAIPITAVKLSGNSVFALAQTEGGRAILYNFDPSVKGNLELPIDDVCFIEVGFKTAYVITATEVHAFDCKGKLLYSLKGMGGPFNTPSPFQILEYMQGVVQKDAKTGGLAYNFVDLTGDRGGVMALHHLQNRRAKRIELEVVPKDPGLDTLLIRHLDASGKHQLTPHQLANDGYFTTAPFELPAKYEDVLHIDLAEAALQTTLVLIQHLSNPTIATLAVYATNFSAPLATRSIDLGGPQIMRIVPGRLFYSIVTEVSRRDDEGSLPFTHFQWTPRCVTSYPNYRTLEFQASKDESITLGKAPSHTPALPANIRLLDHPAPATRGRADTDETASV